MSDFLADVLSDEIQLSDAEVQLLTKNIRKMPGQERRQLYALLKDRPEIKDTLARLWAGGDTAVKEAWLFQTASSIIDRTGDRDSLDKVAGQLIGNIKVYNKVQQLCDERKVVLKATASEGGCTLILILATILVSLMVLALKYI